MNNILKIVLIGVLCLAASFMQYLYLNHIAKGGKSFKDLFSLSFDKRNCLISIVVFVLSVAVLLYSFLYVKHSEMKALINAMITIWIFTAGIIDLRKKIIPNTLVLCGIIFWALVSMLELIFTSTTIKQVLAFSLVGAGLCGGALFVIALIVKSALGMGDVKMFFVIGLLYGISETYSILLFSIFLMAIVSIVLLLMKKATRKTAIPMAPFVALGFLVNVFLGV